jgi:hypothetical protein
VGFKVPGREFQLGGHQHHVTVTRPFPEAEVGDVFPEPLRLGEDLPFVAW